MRIRTHWGVASTKHSPHPRRHSALLGAALTTGLLIFAGTITSLAPPAADAATPTFTVSATTSPATLAIGGTETIVASVSARAASVAAVDIELYNSSGKVVLEQAFDSETFTAGQTKTYTFTWTAPAKSSSGSYSVQIGVFSTDWATQYIWNDAAGGFVVGTGGPVTTPTATPRPPTRTPTAVTAPTSTRTPTLGTGPTATRTPTRATTAPATPTRTATSAPTIRPTSTPTSMPTTGPSPTSTRAPTAGSGSMSGLHVSGNQILNGTGAPVQFLGVNRSSAEYACAEGWGIFDGSVDQSEVNAMLAWHINSVRIPLNEDCWLSLHGVQAAYAGANYQNAVAAYVTLLNNNNISVILNLHFNGNGTSLAVEQEPMPDRAHSPAFWSSVAARFANQGGVMFEPYNEPYPDNGQDSVAGWTCWRDGGTCPGVSFTAAGMQEIVTAIRTTGAQNIIIATGQNWGSQLSKWQQYRPSDPANQLAAGWHSYGDGLDCQDTACWNSTLAGVLATTPIVTTEIGEFDCAHSYIDKVMSFLDSKGMGYFAWAWGPYNCSAEPALITDWSGTPTQTFGQGYKTHLLSRP